MIEDRIKWNEKYKEGRESTLHTTLVRFYHLANTGKALDVACGTGETSVFLAKKGFQVDAFDISDVAIKKARKKAKNEGVKINFKVCDAEKFSWKPESYDLIIDFFFLERSVLPKMYRSLKRGGLLIFETYNKEHLSVNPSFNPNFLLEKGELLRAFKGMELLYYCEVANITTFVGRKV